MKKTSFHFVVDDKEAYQLIPITEHAWHAGDGEEGPGNLHSISIEICESGDRLKTLQNAVELTKKVLVMANLTPDHIFQHNHWSGKDCPRILRDPAFIKDGLDWNWFMKQVRGEQEDDDMIETKQIPVSFNGKPTTLPAINYAGHNYVMLRSLADVEKELEERKKQEEENKKQERIAEIRKRMEDIKTTLASMDYKTIKYVEGNLTEEEFTVHKAKKLTLREEYSALEAELVDLAVVTE